MSATTTGMLIKALRKEHGLTQAALAALLHISDKTVSKWERDAGLPDVSLLPALAEALNVSAETLLHGRIKPNQEDTGSMRRLAFYRCPICGSIMTGTGQARVICCDRPLAPMKAQAADEAHQPVISTVEDETLLTFNHPMEKSHHIAFVAQVGYDRMMLVRLYAEGSQEVRLPRMPYARVFVGCTQDGLYQVSTR